MNVEPFFGLGKQATWPPKINKTIITKIPNINKIFIGKVRDVIENKAIISLMNNRRGESNKLEIFDYNLWNYIDEDNIVSLMKKFNLKLFTKHLKKKLDNNYKQFLKKYKKIEIEPIELKFTESIYDIKPKGLKKEEEELKTELVFEEQPKVKYFHEINENNDNNKDTDVFTINKNDIMLPSKETMDFAFKILKKFKDIDKKYLGFVTSKTLTLDNLIINKEDEINEGLKIIHYLKNIFENDSNSLITNLESFISDGYVVLTRTTIDNQPKITENMVGNLEFFNWQYDKPIDYNTLKFFILQNDYQLKTIDDFKRLQEADYIMSQDYFIAFQPIPEYQLWFIIRLLLAWYADIDLQNNIRKIKVLINQFRANDNEQFNIKNGVLPSIIIFPKYGPKSTKIVLSRLSELFSFYVNKGWENSSPTYFVKINNLMYYSNGSMGLKTYFRNVKKTSKDTIKNVSFNQQLTRFTKSENFFDK